MAKGTLGATTAQIEKAECAVRLSVRGQAGEK